MKILHFPLSRITLGFVTGILMYPFIPDWIFIGFGLFFVFLISLLGIYLVKNKNIFLKNSFGILVLLTSISAGITTQTIHKQTHNKNHYLHQITDFDISHSTEILIVEKLKNTLKNKRYVVEINTVDGRKSFGKAILNIRLQNDTVNFKIGSILVTNGIFYKNKSAFNPNQFNYGRYLERQEIYAQIYTQKADIEVIGYQKSIWAFFSNYREKLISIFEKSGLAERELSVFIALLLGQQQDISPEVLKGYQYSGAVHILSVSGLHVGFIMLFINFLLKPIPNSKRGSLFKVVIIILSLWAFALLAGLSPSVVRSVTMFSFLAIGNNLRRDVNIFHSLLVSMLIILCFNPSFIYDVGFQLSYLALFFILWMQPIFDKIYIAKNRISEYFWGIITMSTSAQIGAMPLSIYYFHQFPGLFFVTNLLVLPVLGIVMAIGVIALGFAATGFVPVFVIKPLEWSIWIVNEMILWVASFDEFVIRNISFSEQMLWSSYLAIVLWIIWLKHKSFNRLSFALLSAISLQIVFIYQKANTFSAREGIVFNQSKNTIITERIGKNITIFSNDSILNIAENNMAVQSYSIGNFAEITQKKSVQNLLYINNKKVVVIDSQLIYLPKINPDIVLLVNSPKINLERILKHYNPKIVIADGSNYKSYNKLWEATCRKQKIPFHNTYEKGFYKF